MEACAFRPRRFRSLSLLFLVQGSARRPDKHETRRDAGCIPAGQAPLGQKPWRNVGSSGRTRTTASKKSAVFTREGALRQSPVPAPVNGRLTLALRSRFRHSRLCRLVLSESVSAEEAVEKSGRSRQNLEAMRRKGQALALRVGQQ